MAKDYDLGNSYCHPIGILSLVIGVPLAVALYNPSESPNPVGQQFPGLDGGSVLASTPYRKLDSGVYIASSTNALELYTTH